MIDSLKSDYNLPLRMAEFIDNSYQFCYNRRNGTIAIGEIVEGSIRHVEDLEYGFYNSPINSIDISEDKTKLAIGDGYGASVLDLVKNRLQTGGNYLVNSIRFFNDGNHVIYGGQIGRVELRETSTSYGYFTIDSARESKVIEDIEIVATSDSLLLACYGDWLGNIYYTVSNFRENIVTYKSSIAVHKGIVTDILFLPRNKLVASSGNDNTVKLFSIDSFSVIKTLKGPTKSKLGYTTRGRESISMPAADVDKGISSITSLSNGRLLAIAGEGGSIEIYDLNDYTHQFSLPGHQSSISRVEGIGTLLVSGAKSGEVKFWDIEKRTEIASFKAHNREISEITITNDQKFAFTASADHSIKLWDLTSMQLAATIIFSTGIWGDDYFIYTPQGHFDWGGEFRRILIPRVWIKYY